MYYSDLTISIPTPCQKCGGRMKAVQYDVPLRFLKQRTYLVCKYCKFVETAEEFKKRLCTV